MKIKNMTGYMLGTSRNIRKPGAPWTGDNTPVWICPTLRKAVEILENSNRACCLEGNVVWTTVYRVVARDIVCVQMKNGLWFTETPTKIYVDSPVFSVNPLSLTEEQLLQNAKVIMPRMTKLTRKAFKERMK